MNSKQRVRTAIARRPVDQVPLGFYAVDHDTIEAVLGRKTYVRSKIDTQVALWQGRRDEVAESLRTDTVEFYRKIDCADIILPKEAHILPPADYEPVGAKQIEDDKWQTGDGAVFQAVREVNEIRCIHDPNAGRVEFSVEDFAEQRRGTPPDESCFEAVDYVLDQLGGERYIPSLVPTTGLVLLGGMQNGLMMYALRPEVVHAAAWQQMNYQNGLDAYYIRPGSAGVMFDHDMGGTNGPLISPAMFQEMVLPYFRHRARRVKTFRDQLILHNCGNTIPLMEMLIEAGVDCYQSLQTNAGMEVGRLKALFGDRLCFWGGVAVEALLSGTPADVRRQVRTAMRRGAPGGGFILGPSHSIAKNTPYENFMAMLEEFVKLRDKF
jgi:hypothetical protein